MHTSVFLPLRGPTHTYSHTSNRRLHSFFWPAPPTSVLRRTQSGSSLRRCASSIKEAPVLQDSFQFAAVPPVPEQLPAPGHLHPCYAGAGSLSLSQRANAEAKRLMGGETEVCGAAIFEPIKCGFGVIPEPMKPKMLHYRFQFVGSKSGNPVEPVRLWFSPCWVPASPRGRKSPRCCLEFWQIVTTNRPNKRCLPLGAEGERTRGGTGIPESSADFQLSSPTKTSIAESDHCFRNNTSLPSRHGYLVFLQPKHLKKCLAHKWRNQPAEPAACLDRWRFSRGSFLSSPGTDLGISLTSVYVPQTPPKNSTANICLHFLQVADVSLKFGLGRFNFSAFN